MSSKIKFQIEFPFHSSPELLYQYIATASGLSEWFADNVNSRGELFTFVWDGIEEQAKLLRKKKRQYVQFKWLGEDTADFFEMRILVHEITKGISLIITDFADEDELEETKMFWENQVSELKQVLGFS